MSLDIADRFVESGCTPVVGLSNPTAGSITRASIAHLNASQLDTMFKSGGLFADLEAWFLHAFEMQVCGTPRFAFYDWIYANVDRTEMKNALKATPVKGGPGLLYPWVFAMQDTIQNRDYWRIVNGCIKTTGGGSTGYTGDTLDAAKEQDGGTSGLTGPLTAAQLALTGTRVIRVDSRFNMPMDPAWFRDRSVLHIFNSSAAGVSQRSAYKVMAAAIDTAATYIDVLVADQNSGSTTAYDAAPTSGVIMEGLNNVNDYESWRVNRPNIDGRKRVPVWYQTWRMARTTDSEYEAWFGRVMESNIAARNFGDIDAARRNAQDEEAERRAFVVAFLWNKPLPNQNLTDWESLEAINTPTGTVLDVMSGKIIGRRANFIGVIEQLQKCDRVIDLAGGVLHWAEFLEQCYDLVRARKGKSQRKVTDLDFWVNSTMASLIHTAMIGEGGYYAGIYGASAYTSVWNIGENDKIGDGVQFNSYKVQRPPIRLNFIYDYSWDDFLAQCQAEGHESAGNMILCLDIGKPPNGSIYYAQLAANRINSRTADVEELARLDSILRGTMKVLSERVNMTSETGAPVVECPLNSLVITGVALAAPNMTAAKTVPYSDLLV